MGTDGFQMYYVLLQDMEAILLSSEIQMKNKAGALEAWVYFSKLIFS